MNQSLKNQPKPDENTINKILKEKIFTKNYVDTLHIICGNLCSENTFKLIHSSLYDYIKIFSQIIKLKY